jgi:hypothetical protein
MGPLRLLRFTRAPPNCDRREYRLNRLLSPFHFLIRSQVEVFIVLLPDR